MTSRLEHTNLDNMMLKKAQRLVQVLFSLFHINRGFDKPQLWPGDLSECLVEGAKVPVQHVVDLGAGLRARGE